MSRWIKLLFITVSLSLLTVPVLGPPSKCVEEYAVIGDYEGAPWEPGVVGNGLVGTKPWCSTLEPGIWLTLSTDLAPAGVETVYRGKVRCLTGSGGHPARFDFYFSTDGTTLCHGDSPDNQNPCQYQLIVLDGIYDKYSETILFQSAPTDEPNAFGADRLLDPVPPGPDYKHANFFVELFPDEGGGGETGPEKTLEQCTDEADNDGDGRIDCADPNCKKWCP
jgi:hypothetical protein